VCLSHVLEADLRTVGAPALPPGVPPPRGHPCPASCCSRCGITLVYPCWCTPAGVSLVLDREKRNQLTLS